MQITCQLSIQKCLLLLAPDRRDSVNSVRRLLSWIYIIERIMTKSCGYPNITPICDFFLNISLQNFNSLRPSEKAFIKI